MSLTVGQDLQEDVIVVDPSGEHELPRSVGPRQPGLDQAAEVRAVVGVGLAFDQAGLR